MLSILKLKKKITHNHTHTILNVVILITFLIDSVKIVIVYRFVNLLINTLFAEYIYTNYND